MTRIGITGANGFLGWHLRSYLHALKDFEVISADRIVMNDPVRLREFAAGADAIVHLAGANRGDNSTVHETNVALAQQLISACESAGIRPHVVYANSTHSARDTPYGESKRIAAEKLAAWATKAQARFTNLVLPHVFGEHCRPHYNSAIATFCHQLARGEAPRIIEDGQLELIHAQTVAENIINCIVQTTVGDVRLAGTPIMVSAALTTLRKLAGEYSAQIIPDFENALALELFNCYRSCLFPQHYPVGLQLRTDSRGSLFEGVKTHHGGQGFLSTTRPGITRGNHYHRRKFERFLVVQGDALIRIRRLLTNEVAEFRVSGSQPAYVDMPVLHTHNITNTGSTDLMTLFWTQEIFDPANTDTYSETV